MRCEREARFCQPVSLFYRLINEPAFSFKFSENGQMHVVVAVVVTSTFLGTGVVFLSEKEGNKNNN